MLVSVTVVGTSVVETNVLTDTDTVVIVVNWVAVVVSVSVEVAVAVVVIVVGTKRGLKLARTSPGTLKMVYYFRNTS